MSEIGIEKSGLNNIANRRMDINGKATLKRLGGNTFCRRYFDLTKSKSIYFILYVFFIKQYCHKKKDI